MSKLAEAYEAFREVQSKYASFGAYDTEPRSVFYRLIADIHDGKEPEVPTTARGWQLYSDMPGVGVAARALAAAARKAVKAAKADAIGTAQFVNYW